MKDYKHILQSEESFFNEILSKMSPDEFAVFLLVFKQKLKDAYYEMRLENDTNTLR